MLAQEEGEFLVVLGVELDQVSYLADQPLRVFLRIPIDKFVVL